MSNHEHFLQLFLRIIGTTSLTAAFFVFVPQAWLEAIHQQLGLGNLPAAPVVSYLARSTSAFYALLVDCFGSCHSTCAGIVLCCVISAWLSFCSGWRCSALTGRPDCHSGGSSGKGRSFAHSGLSSRGSVHELTNEA